MNDAAPWVDPELIAAGQVAAEKGLVTPDRTVASIAEVRAASERTGAFLGEGSVPLKDERDLVVARAARPGAVPALYADRGGTPGAPRLRPWRRVHAGQHPRLGPFPARPGAPERRRRAVGRLPAVARGQIPGRVRGNGGDGPARRARGRRVRHRPGRLAVGGDSAGGNLALAAALAMRDAGEKALRFQLLLYGCFTTDCDSPSWQRFGQGAGLSQSQMRWIWETYLGEPEQRSDWRAAPISARPRGGRPRRT